MSSLKKQKEAFVTGLDGTTPQELLLICSSPAIGLWLFQYFPTGSSQWKSILAEAVTFWIPMILCQTKYLFPWGAAYLATEVFVAASCEIGRACMPSSARDTITRSSDGSDDGKLGYLTVYRSALMYLTFVAILAVDFHVFPRRFVKTEETGYSLMDLGAASFVIAAGLVSPRARSKKQNTRITWKRYATRLLPLVLMGSLRLVTHKELDYQLHSSEYGVHWNFFFTLAALVPVAATLPGPSWIVPVLIIGAYQYFLSEKGLQEWVVDAPRSCESAPDNLVCNLFVANREGVLGCIGYGTLYLMSEWIGYRFVWFANSHFAPVYGGLFTCVVALFALWLLLLTTGIPVSRRTTNIVFLVWSLLVNMMQLTGIQYAWTRANKVPTVLLAVNRHGLLTFILANLLTGAVNLLINTLEVSDSMALFVLFVYVSVVGIVAMLIDGLAKRVWRIKGKQD